MSATIIYTLLLAAVFVVKKVLVDIKPSTKKPISN